VPAVGVAAAFWSMPRWFKRWSVVVDYVVSLYG
jgi:hypothetical protein